MGVTIDASVGVLSVARHFGRRGFEPITVGMMKPHRRLGMPERSPASARRPWRQLARWSATAWAQLYVLTAVLVAVAMVVVAQTAQVGAQRHERTEIMLETIRADSQALDAIRGEALSAVELHARERIHVGGSLVTQGWQAMDQLYGSLAQLSRLDHRLATGLRADARTILTLGTTIFEPATGKQITPALVRAQRHFTQTVDRLDSDTQREAAAESRVAAGASSDARTAFIGSLVLGLLALLLIATRVHRLRRRLAVEAAQEAMEFHNEARLRALLEHAGDIVTVVGTDLTVRWQAASITRILGHGASALLGKPLTSLVHPDEVVLVEHFLASGLTGTSIQGLTIRLGTPTAAGARSTWSPTIASPIRRSAASC